MPRTLEILDACFDQMMKTIMYKHKVVSGKRKQNLGANSLFARLISHQPAVLFSQNEPATSNQPQPASSTLLSEQTSTSHQPPANRTGCKSGETTQ
jgi:hypothetical protein